VQVRGAQAQAWFEFGRLAQAVDAARAADTDAQRLGFDQHFFAVDHLRALAGAALERRDLDTAEQLAERALSISEHGRPAFAFLGMLDRAEIWATRGHIREALATIDAARQVLKGTRSVLLARADELEAVLRLALGDLRYPADLASSLPAARRGLLLAKIALAADDPHAAQEHLRTSPLADVTPRHALVRQLLLAAAAIGCGDPTASGTCRCAANRPPGRIPQHGRHDRTPGDHLPGRALHPGGIGSIHGATDRRRARRARPQPDAGARRGPSSH
jgi:hypothetical protein